MSILSDEELREHKQTHTKDNSWWLHDARGYEVGRVCDKCEATVKSKFRPEIFEDGNYQADEPLEPEDY